MVRQTKDPPHTHTCNYQNYGYHHLYHFIFQLLPFSTGGILIITYSISAISLHIRTILHWIRSESALLLLISRSVPFKIFNVLKCPINPVALRKRISLNVHNKHNCNCNGLNYIPFRML